MHQKQLFPLIRKHVKELLNGYIQDPLILTSDEIYTKSTGFGDDSVLLGAFVLAIYSISTLSNK